MSVSRPGSSPAIDPTSVAAPTSSTASTARASANIDVLVVMYAAAALTVTYLLAVRTRAGQTFDTRAMTVVARSLDGVNWAATLLTVISPGTVLLATALLALAAWAGRGASVGVIAAVTAAGTILVAVALKSTLDRPLYFDGLANSFPSGHVSAVAGLAAGATFAVQRTWRVLVALVGLVAVAMTGLATLALQWHRPSDVLASVLLAVIVALAAKSWLARRAWRLAVQTAGHVSGEVAHRIRTAVVQMP